MSIRIATLSDIPAIMQIITDVVPIMRAAGNLQWDDTYPNPQVFEEDIIAGQLWVAEVDGQIAGVTAITTEQYPEYAQVGLDISEEAIVTHRLAVSPRFRGRGLAADLLQQAEVVALQRGIHTLRIDTNSHNHATQQLFPKLGYSLKGEITLQFRPGLKFVCFEKRLD
ncbi:GNAT family N-acetyltransferase [Mucilaginibacter phyllosphaerae]|uniref:GNAT family N-acetyltransferase n=1 Tax=Mucilaginibacter phyllosphaerae TaxID=1812349 RepID=A0A4Y8AKN2_9SPHI|nr:GNAT family N-acetyltransferase [Mucilaginibacter phyllosphaerae]MBB3967760.1 GNAT superfamily N-acetyltransferase [Mucilaginibacter phyllosphaerae]TEW69192.1 GNAT family N-acetyltransferase [Mucilaginibacter phyllosphaerae]GGH03516.1 N-acetyltransferase [Mucilaginibacter phyllosphaerae]